ncbi:MAG: 50S ribosomal protein L19e [Candidatus Aenigmarchaeota archaeon]|nr:50S ribosomal protein L19e [Candidatus Aenigmarchaeota archaeon]
MDKKRLASRILKIGKSRVWLNPENKKEVSEAITAQDIRMLVRKGVVKKLPEKKTISINKNKRKEQGRRKGAKHSRITSKRKWIIKIRGLRAELKYLKEEGLIEKLVYNDLYRKAKGGFFRDKSHLKNYLERQELLKSAAN